jgi:hypothetical protein
MVIIAVPSFADALAAPAQLRNGHPVLPWTEGPNAHQPTSYAKQAALRLAAAHKSPSVIGGYASLGSEARYAPYLLHMLSVLLSYRVWLLSWGGYGWIRR